MTSTRTAITALACALALIGCNGDTDATTAEDTVPAAPTVEETTTTVDPNDALATDPNPSGPGVYTFEYEGAVGTVDIPDGGTRITADVDNTGGADIINIYSVVIVTEDGEQIEAMSGGHDGMYLRPGARGTGTLEAASEITSVSQVYVYPSGGGAEVVATKG